MKKLLFTLAALLIAGNAMADRVVTFDAEYDEPTFVQFVQNADGFIYGQFELSKEGVTITYYMYNESNSYPWWVDGTYCCSSPTADEENEEEEPETCLKVFSALYSVDNDENMNEAYYGGIRKIEFECYAAVPSEYAAADPNNLFVIRPHAYDDSYTVNGNYGTYECFSEYGRCPQFVDFGCNTHVRFKTITVTLYGVNDEPVIPDIPTARSLTVCDGEYMTQTIPICGLYADTYGSMSQSIYPATMLEEMKNGQITDVTFYTTGDYYENVLGYTSTDVSDYINFDNAKYQLALMEVAEDGFAEIVAIVGATPVATAVPVRGEYTVTFTLDEPFAYNGGNLLVEVMCIQEGSWGQTYWLGEEATTLASYYNASYAQNTVYFLPKATFGYEESGETPPVVDQVGAPTFVGYTEDGIYGYGVYIVPTTEGSSIKYRVFIEEDDQWVLITDWTDYLGIPMEIWMNEAEAKYRVEAYAYIGEVKSNTVAYEYQVEPWTSINEMNAGKTIADVRYFNMAGQEMPEANGLTIVVTTYTDGTTNAVKVVK